MTTELSRVASRQLTLPTRDIADLTMFYLSHVERETWNTTTIGVELPSADRAALVSRLCQIDAVCVPSSDNAKFERARIDKVVSYMIGMFTVGRKISEKEAAGTVKGYVLALEGVPAHFVEKACLDFAQGRVEGHDNAYTPTSAQVRSRAEELMVPFRQESAKIRTIINSRKQIRPTPEEHKRMLAKTRAVIDGTDPDIKTIRDRIEADRQQQKEIQALEIGRANEAQRRRMCEHFGTDPSNIASPLLMMKINGRVQPTETRDGRNRKGTGNET